MITKLKEELPDYLFACKRVSMPSTDTKREFTDGILLWWAKNHSKFPAWAEAARIVFCMTCNSAGVERVFSCMANLFGDKQLSSLGDYIEGSCMLAYNRSIQRIGPPSALG